MRNKHAGTCFKCGKVVKAGEGYFQSVGSSKKLLAQHRELKTKYSRVSRWLVRCKHCVGTGN